MLNVCLKHTCIVINDHHYYRAFRHDISIIIQIVENAKERKRINYFERFVYFSQKTLDTIHEGVYSVVKI